MAGFDVASFTRGQGDWDFDRSYSWEVKIDTAPSPFDEWFPAVVSDEPIADINVETFVFSTISFDVPISQNSFSLQIEFYDESIKRLRDWLRDWRNQIFPKSGGVTCLQQSTKKCFINKLSLKNEILSTVLYNIFPQGKIEAKNSSENELRMYSVLFGVAGFDDTSV